MILLAFLLPFSVYLLILGIVNRRPHPVLVPGTWDFVGVLFAASGFLLVVGPAVISSGSESWRMFWLFGTKGAGVPAVTEEAARIWGILAALYFAFVVAGTVYLLRQRRGQTAVYNVESGAFEISLAKAFGTLGLNPLRTGNVIVFGTANAPSQAHGVAAMAGSGPKGPSHSFAAGDGFGLTENDLVSESAVLELDAFRAMRHVTLHWEPPLSPLRREVERELEHTLAQVTSTNHPVGDWLVLIAMALIAFNLFATFGLTLTNLLHR